MIPHFLAFQAGECLVDVVESPALPRFVPSAGPVLTILVPPGGTPSARSLSTAHAIREEFEASNTPYKPLLQLQRRNIISLIHTNAEDVDCSCSHTQICFSLYSYFSLFHENNGLELQGKAT